MRNCLKAEIYKMLHKKEFYIIHVCLMALTALFAVLIGTNSNIMNATEESIGGGFFIIFILDFFTTLFVLPILSTVFVSGIWSKEIGDGTINQSIVKSGNRTKLLIAKIIVELLAGVSLILNCVLCASIFYEIFAKTGKCYSDDFFGNIGDRLVLYILLNVLFILVFQIIMNVISIKLDGTKTIIASVILLVVLKLLEKIADLKEYIPTYVASSTYAYSETVDTKDIVVRMVIFVVVLAAGICATYGLFRKKEF